MAGAFPGLLQVNVCLGTTPTLGQGSAKGKYSWNGFRGVAGDCHHTTPAKLSLLPHPPSNSSTVSFTFLKLQLSPTIPSAWGKLYQHSGHLGTRQELQQGREQLQGQQSRTEEGIIRWGGQRRNT